MAYIGKSPSRGVRNRFQYQATAGQQTFSSADANGLTLTYTDSLYMDVYQNGILLVPGDDYTATTGTTVVLVQAASLNDIVEMVVYDVFSVNDSVSASSGGTFSSAVTFGGGVVVANGGNIGSASDTDAMSISSGGVVTFTQPPLGDFNSPYWFGQKTSEQAISRVTATNITGMTTNEKDSHSAFDGTTFTVPSGGAGIYFIFGTIFYDFQDVGDDGELASTRLIHTPSGGSEAEIARGIKNYNSSQTNRNQTIHASCIFQLGVGDTVLMRAFSADHNGGGGGKAVENFTNFGGFKMAGV